MPDFTHVVDLSGAWSFAFSSSLPAVPICTAKDLKKHGLEVFECTVPGNFELDLHAIGRLPDPFLGTNIFALRAYEKSNVFYFRRFKAARKHGATAQLRFEGIDCFASVYLDGALIGQTDNMLIEHAFEIEDHLTEQGTEHEVLVHIQPAVQMARVYDYPPSVAAGRGGMEALYARKAPHMYGWDILPRAVSAGLWRPVCLQYRPLEHIQTAYLRTVRLAPDRSQADLVFAYRARLGDFVEGHYDIHIHGACGKSVFESTQSVRFEAGRLAITVKDPALWWPRGRGEASLYTVVVSLRRNGHVIDQTEFEFGVRTVELARTSTTDEEGHGEFCFWVNGERVFILGTNWVAADAFHSRDIDRIPKMLDLVEEAGCNMVRCWGGNVYENDLFYTQCDRKGIMVWQDFTMACAVYPQDEAFQAALRREATHVVRRLRHHACIVLWAGDNECDQAYGWHEAGDPNRNVLTRRVLPEVLQAEDVSRPYLPSSPYLDEATCAAGEKYATEAHLWGPRDYYKSAYYTQSLAHFASEIGYHGCPDPQSLRQFLSPDKLWPCAGNDEWNLHSTSPLPGEDFSASRVELMANQVRELFGAVPGTLEGFAFASQASQAEAMKFFVERFRAGKWRRTGIIWWNMIDGWPQMSDAIVDYYFAKKLAFAFVQRAQAPVSLIFREPHDGSLELVVANDLREDVPIEYRVRDVASGKLATHGQALARADAVTPLTQIPFSTSERGLYWMDWTYPGSSGSNHYLFGNPPFDLATYRGWLCEAGVSFSFDI